ncbi:MAG: amidase [Acidimicrobiales bacterium]
MVSQRELLPVDAVGLSALVRSGELQPGEILDATIARIEALDGTINAVIDRAFERARSLIEQVPAEAPFAGIPTFVKDLIDVEGLRRSEGSRLRMANVSEASPDYILKLEQAGLIIAGKTNTPEFASLPVTDNEVFGKTLNPWSLDHSPGGSSGGSAAAVAAGYTPIVHGTDGGGSNRIPSSACGLFGMKASRGRQASGELDGSHPVFKTHHAISRTVRDSATLFAATEIQKGGAYPAVGLVTNPTVRRLRVAVSPVDVLGDSPEPAARAALDSTMELLVELGHEVTEVPNPVDGSQFYTAYRNLFLARTVGMLDMIEAQAGAPVEQTGLLTPLTISLMRQSDQLAPDAAELGEAYLQALSGDMEEFFGRADVWLSLVHPHDSIDATEFDPMGEFDRHKSETYLSNAAVANMSGSPSMSVPLTFDTPTGVPIGSMFTAAPGADGLLYELAFALEEAQPWADRWAPHSAMFSHPEVEGD